MNRTEDPTQPEVNLSAPLTPSPYGAAEIPDEPVEPLGLYYEGELMVPRAIEARDGRGRAIATTRLVIEITPSALPRVVAIERA